MSRRHAEVVGGGLGGLGVAIALAQSGWTVRVHEARPELRMYGGALHLWENGLLVLEKYGTLDKTLERSNPIATWSVFDDKCHELQCLEYRDPKGDRLYLPPRAALNRALVLAAEREGVEIVTNSAGVYAAPDGSVGFSDGSTLKADLVIAADGLRSRLRESLRLTKKLEQHGGASTRMLVPTSVCDPGNRIDTYMGHGDSGDAGMMLGGASHDSTYVSIFGHYDNPRNSQIPLDTEYWVSAYPVHRELMEALSEISREEGQARRDRHSQVTCKSWSAGKVAIVGDAAHGLSPYLGQGANLALQNGLALSVALDGAKDVPSALQAWEQRERKLTNHAQFWSKTLAMLSEDWPKGLLRPQIMRLTNKSAWVGKQLDRPASNIPRGTEEIAARRRKAREAADSSRSLVAPAPALHQREQVT
ncbi:MAG: FAD-dependent oxidoreductase [Solirubrobacterales bacterium]